MSVVRVQKKEYRGTFHDEERHIDHYETKRNEIHSRRTRNRYRALAQKGIDASIVSMIIQNLIPYEVWHRIIGQTSTRFLPKEIAVHCSQIGPKSVDVNHTLQCLGYSFGRMKIDLSRQSQTTNMARSHSNACTPTYTAPCGRNQ